MAPQQNLRHHFKTFPRPTKHIQQGVERVSRRGAPELWNPVKKINGVLGCLSLAIKTNEMGENVFGCVEFLDEFKAVKN